MQTLMAIIALANGIASGNIPERPRWQSNYFDARAQAISSVRPLAVFIGSGKTDWQKGVRDSSDVKVSQLLREKYVFVFVDTDSESGQKVAAEFGIKAKGLIISDRGVNAQQFFHSGDVTASDLAKALARYADPNRAFRSTETLAQLNPPPAPAYAPSYAPTFRLSGG